MNLKDAAERLRAKVRGASSSTMVQLARPKVGPTPEPLRRFVEPVIAAVALSILAILLGIAMSSAGMLFICAGLMYAIITQVFGIDLDINPIMAGAR